MNKDSHEFEREPEGEYGGEFDKYVSQGYSKLGIFFLHPIYYILSLKEESIFFFKKSWEDSIYYFPLDQRHSILTNYVRMLYSVCVHV